MCGIFGTINGGNINKDLFREATKLLAHRGPDSVSFKFLDNVAFGFTRLSIQDLTEAGNQPMKHPGAAVYIVFNGEIYNFKVLRSELEREGAKFASGSDTEVILHAYIAWGWKETLKRCEGMFGMVLYDEEKGLVYMARDRFGMKPLFFSETGETGLVFSSEIKSILHFKGSAKLDYADSLNPIFTTGLSPRGRTMFRGVRQLNEGETLKYDIKKGTFVTYRYFDLKDWVDESLYKEIRGYSKRKLLEVYGEAFNDAVEKHILSDAPLASLFSAGIDSALVTELAARHRPVKLYHFEPDDINLLKYPRFFAKEHGLELVIAKGNDKDYIFDLPKMIYSYETINKEEGPVLANLCKLARQDGIKALLTGDSSDEIFGGQPHHVLFMIQNSYYSFKPLRYAMKALNHFFPDNLTQYTRENPLGTYYCTFPPWNSMNEVPLDCLYHKGERLAEWQECLDAYSFVKNKCERELLAYMLDEARYRLQRFMIRADRIGMMESVELRIPFLHQSIVKLAVNTPTNWRMRKKSFWRGYEKKYIVKELAVSLGLQRSLAYRKKLATPHNSRPQVVKLIKQWPLTNLSEFLKIPESTLKKIALESYDNFLDRIRYSFLSTEVLIRLFVRNESCEQISEEFRKIIL